MKIIMALIFSAVSYAAIEENWLYTEYRERVTTKFTPLERSILSSLQLSGLKMENVLHFTVDATGETFQFENLSYEKCTGAYVNKKATYTCSSKWNEDQLKTVKQIATYIPLDQIHDLSIYTEKKHFIFQTNKGEICYGSDGSMGFTFNCYTKVGVMSFFAGGDSD